MRHGVGIAACALVLAPLVALSCNSSDPPVFPVFPAECVPQAATLSGLIGLTDGCDAGECRSVRNRAIDDLAVCLKGLP